VTTLAHITAAGIHDLGSGGSTATQNCEGAFAEYVQDSINGPAVLSSGDHDEFFGACVEALDARLIRRRPARVLGSPP
jgi:hypothetical protein